MIELIEEILYCLENNKLRVALGMALTLPDICGKIEFSNKMSVTDRYVNWCKKYLFNEGYLTVNQGENNIEQEKYRVIDPLHCYKLRCAYLHSGNSVLNQRQADDFPEFELRISSSEEEKIYLEPFYMESCKKCDDKIKKITVDVRHLCKVMCNTAKKYYDQHQKKDFIEHSFKIVDVEKIADSWRQCKINAQNIMRKKNNPNSYEELSESAKILLNTINENGINEIMPESLDSEKDKETMKAILELIMSEMILYSPEVFYEELNNKKI